MSFLNLRGPLACLLLAGLGFHSCKDPQPNPVDQVINSFSDSLPNIALPDDADPADADWAGIDLEPKPPVKPKYPEEQAGTFLLPEGYHIAPVLTEPQIEQPGAIAFDGNGRMYVLELRTYMLTADSEGELDPVSRISRWEDTDGDGVYETGGVFVDSLIFPRFVLPYGKDCILAMESDADNVYRYTDTDGDGKADKKEFFTNKFGRAGNVEHQQAFLYYGMDNWLYSTVNAFRVRETPGGVIRESTGFNRAQWGITHDDDGKLWFLGGASGLPSYFQFPIHYGNFQVEDQYAEGFDIPWGAPVKIADMQGGMDQVRQPDGSLNLVTGAAGNDIFRGDRLPAELYGQLLYGEPVARIVRQVNPVVTEGLTTLHNVFQEQQSEFIRSTDPLFRPVDMTTAPDGTLYVTDMYHGIIQEGQWAQKGSYLRTKIEQYQLDKVVKLGRIWRVTHDSKQRDTERPRMLDQKPAELVQYLSHPNGWWRDKAQQLIVLSGDTSLGPELAKLARSGGQLTARIHAIWSLEGLGLLTSDLVRELAADPEPRIRIQALRAGETLYKKGNSGLQSVYTTALQDRETDVAIQAMLSAKHLQLEGREQLIADLLKANKAKGVQLVGSQILDPPAVRSWFNPPPVELLAEQQESLERGSVIFNELCVQCHGADGTGTPAGNGQTLAPPLTGSARVQWHPDYVINTIMHGMTGPIDGTNYPGGVMVGNKEQSDQWIADIASFIRLNLTNEASLVSEDQVAEVRRKTSGRDGPYTYETLRAAVPLVLETETGVSASASHTQPTRIGGTGSAMGAFNFEGWTTGEGQQEGMWYQIAFEKPVRLSEMRFHAPSVRRWGSWRPGQGTPMPPPIETYPRAYEIRISDNGQDWKVAASAEGNGSDMVIDLPDEPMKYLRIVLTQTLPAADDIPWSMNQMRIYQQPGATAASDKVALK